MFVISHKVSKDGNNTVANTIPIKKTQKLQATSERAV